jgi:hypothetical protein
VRGDHTIRLILGELERGNNNWLEWVDLVLVSRKPSPEDLVLWKLLRDRESAIAVLRSTLGETG